MAPITLTRQQFLQRRPGGSYQAYLNYLAAHRPARVAQRHAAAQAGAQLMGPFAQQPVPTLQDMISQLTQASGGVLSDQQIQERASQLVHSQYDPLLQNLNRLAVSRAQGAAQAITQATQQYAQTLAPLAGQTQADYSRAEQGAAAANDALSQFLINQGAGASGELASKLAQINAPTESQGVTDLASAGMAGGSARQVMGQGTATLENLISSGAGDVAYARKLPGISALAGQQTLRETAAQIESDRSQQEQDLLANMPGTIQQIVSDLQSRNDTIRANAVQQASSLIDSIRNRNLQAGIAAAGFVTDTTKANAAATAAAAKTKEAARQRNLIDVQRSKTTGFLMDGNGNYKRDKNGHKIPVARSKSQAQQHPDWPNPTLSNVYKYIVDSRGRPIKKNGKLDWLPGYGPGGKLGGGTSKAGAARQKRISDAFTAAYTDAGRMYAGTYGRDPNAPVPPTPPGQAPAGQWAFRRAYNAIYAQLEAQLRNIQSPHQIRILTLRALARAGYNVQVTTGAPKTTGKPGPGTR